MDTPLHIVSLTSFAALLVACASSPYPAAPTVPPSLQAPAGSTLYLEALASGVQIYECSRKPDSTYEWAFKAPRQRSRRDPDSRLASITRGPRGRRSMAAPRSVRPRHESLPRHLPRFLGCCSPQSRTPPAVLSPAPRSSSASPRSEVSRRPEVAPSQRSRRRLGFLTRLRTSSTASNRHARGERHLRFLDDPNKFLVADCVRNDCVAKPHSAETLEEPGRTGLKQRCSGA